MDFRHSRLEAFPLRKDQKVAVLVSLILGMAIGLLIAYFQPSRLDFKAYALLSIGFAYIGAGLGCCSLGLKNARGIFGWMGFGLMGIMVSFGLPPFNALPDGSVVLFASWAASFLLICCYHFMMNGVKKCA